MTHLYHSPYRVIMTLIMVWVVGELCPARASIDFWYGDHQVFGASGHTQRYVNVLGHVDRKKTWRELKYSLNGGEFINIAVGPDGRRLHDAGDFNVELPYAMLSKGNNSLEVEAVCADGQVFRRSMILEYRPMIPEMSREIHWDSVERLDTVAQVIDGQWQVIDGQLCSHPQQPGYDRIIGFGDMSWRDFEVVFPFRIQDLDESAYESVTSVAPSLLFTLRWQGHTDSPAGCWQPHCGWEPFGALVSYSFSGDQDEGLHLFTRWADQFALNRDVSLEIGKTYWIRLRSETAALGAVYSIKLWAGDQEEPRAWSLRGLGGALNLTRGAFLVVAHHINLEVGDMEFSPVGLDAMAILGSFRSDLVRWSTQWAETLVQVPYLFIWMVGILWGRYYARRDKRRGMWVSVAFGIIFLCSLAGTLLNASLPVHLQNEGWITRHLSLVFIVINLIPIGGHLVGWTLLMVKLTPNKHERRNDG